MSSLAPTVLDFKISDFDFADVLRKQAAVWRESAREWRVTAQLMPPPLRSMAMSSAVQAEEWARESDAKAAALEARATEKSVG